MSVSASRTVSIRSFVTSVRSWSSVNAGSMPAGTLHGGGSGHAQGSRTVSCQPGSPTTASRASTTFGSNCVPEQRRSSATASAIGIAAR